MTQSGVRLLPPLRTRAAVAAACSWVREPRGGDDVKRIVVVDTCAAQARPHPPTAPHRLSEAVLRRATSPGLVCCRRRRRSGMSAAAAAARRASTDAGGTSLTVDTDRRDSATCADDSAGSRAAASAAAASQV
eukprot:TRINITY_DN10272_c0_g1_i4.p3 TRINITY_DN10272_c0_g1~~TRINITY_DN10272_c0_g1_i4.p3  ORF type:complete len:133 (+),score=29.89 TRINITY_DN10272_c0_g1_i4:283-681(+)